MTDAPLGLTVRALYRVWDEVGSRLRRTLSYAYEIDTILVVQQRRCAGPCDRAEAVAPSLVARATFFGAAIAAIGGIAKAQDGGSGSYSNAAIALPDETSLRGPREEEIRAVKVARAIERGRRLLRSTRRSPEGAQGRMTNVLRKGTERLGLHCRRRGCRRRSTNVCRRIGHASRSRIYLKGSHSPPTRRLDFATCYAAQRNIATQCP